MLDFDQAELRALIQLFKYFHPDKTEDEIEERIALMTKGCLFHWKQTVERMSTRITRDPEEVEQIKQAIGGLVFEEDPDKVISVLEAHALKYPGARHWVDFWLRPRVRRMAFQALAQGSTWDNLPSTNNTAEAAHSAIRRVCKSRCYPIVVASLWEHDFGEFLKLEAAGQGVVTRWSSLYKEAKKQASNKKRMRKAEEMDKVEQGRPMDTIPEYAIALKDWYAMLRKLYPASDGRAVTDAELGGTLQNL